MLAVLKDKHTPQIVQSNAAEVLASFFSPDTPDSSYARGIYWPDKETVREACRVPDYYSLIEPDGRVLPCCLVEISHQGEVGNVDGHTRWPRCGRVRSSSSSAATASRSASNAPHRATGRWA